MEKYNIRLEEPADWQEVENLTREAFWNVYRPRCLEHFVLNRYRSNPDFIPELDFVMEVGGRIVGHLMYSHAELTSDEGDDLKAWTLGPISIHPDWKRKGYGFAIQDGEFVDKVSMEEYIEMCSQFGAQAGMTNEQMREHCRMLFPMLKRWRRK